METLSLPRIIGEGIYDSSTIPRYRHGGTTPERIVETFELEVPTEKGGVLFLGDKSCAVSPNIALAVKPGQKRHTQLPYRCRFIHLTCEGELYNRLMTLPDIIHLTNIKETNRLLDEFILNRVSSPEQNCLLAYSRLLEFIWRLECDSYREKFYNGVQSEAITSVLRFIDGNLEQSLTLEQLAGNCHMNPVYFHRLFKQKMGVTPYRYILDKKLAEAKKQLIMTSKSCLEIALGLGFSSQSYFNYAFKKELGISPLQFRKEHSYIYPDLSR